MEWLTILATGVVAGTVLLFAAIGLLHTFRGTAARYVAADPAAKSPATSDPAFIREMELLARCPISQGSQVEILLNGEGLFPRLWEDLRAARCSITIQQYFVDSGEVVRTLAAVLEERAQAGVRVLFLHDFVGTKALPSEIRDRLRSAGVRTAEFRPARPALLARLNARLHSRGVVIDGRIGYTGGFGFSDRWLGNGRRPGQWRDTGVRFTGPAVGQLQAAFAAAWAEATGALPTGDRFFPASFSGDGTARSGLLHVTAGLGSTPAERFVVGSVAAARRRLWITNSYFAPDENLTQLLIAAVQRGVDVRVLTSGERTDLPIVRWAGRARYEKLLTGGVRIWEYQPAMMHAKTFVIDGIWSSIGAMNFDVRSLVLNDETTLLTLDPGVGSALERAYNEDLRFASEIRLDEFRRRGWADRVREQSALLLAPVL